VERTGQPSTRLECTLAAHRARVQWPSNTTVCPPTCPFSSSLCLPIHTLSLPPSSSPLLLSTSTSTFLLLCRLSPALPCAPPLSLLGRLLTQHGPRFLPLFAPPLPLPPPTRRQSKRRSFPSSAVLDDPKAAAMATFIRQPFADLGAPRLHTLSSSKNRQNGKTRLRVAPCFY
jgi:hypothetical protein